MSILDVGIVPMSQEHVNATVQIHLDSFPHFFSTFLGPKYVSIVYTEILKVPNHIAWVAQDANKKTVGFVMGVTEQSSFFAHMARKHWLNIALASVWAVIRHPQIILRLFRALLYPQKSREASAQALLLSIAVLPTDRGARVGQKLLQAFLGEMKERNVPAVCLTTDADDNEKTNRFYLKAGFMVARTFTTAEGRRINEYLIRLQI
jgi:ribosomal protein S18 acetylase RimI-like enzyme